MSKVSFKVLAAQEAMIRRQQRKETLLSLAVSVAVMAGLMFVLGVVLLPGLLKPGPETLVVQVSRVEDQVDREVRPNRVSSRVPNLPPPAPAPVAVLAAMKSAPVAVPVPDVEVPEYSATLGSGDDFATGWGVESGDPALDALPAGEGSATFFDQAVRAQRVVYVIDYSRSMVGSRERMMRDEVANSLLGLKDGMGFQLILFAGPAWVAGHEVTMAEDRQSAEVHDGERRFRWVQDGGAGNWKSRGLKPAVEWIEATRSSIREGIENVRETPLVYGTCWEEPLEMALGMDPPPQELFFMTDGARGGKVLDVVGRLARKAKRKGVTIHTVAMMEPKAEEAMTLLAKETGGCFTMVRRGGVVERVAAD